MTRVPMSQILEAARQLSGLSVPELWWAYVVLGGTASPQDVEGFLAGSLHPDRAQYDRLAQALNDRFTDLGQNHPVPYFESGL
jgi:hypothetical protein